MDVLVYETQKWLNRTYFGRTGYVPLDLNDENIKGVLDGPPSML